METISGGETTTTNNKMELLAVVKSLEMFIDKFYNPSIKFIEINSLDICLFNIVEETHKWVKENLSERKLVLYATQGTYFSKVYQNFFDENYQIVEPDDDDKKLIWNSIYSHDYGIKTFSNPIKDQAVENLRLVTEKMMDQGYDTFIMGCTEIPLAMGRLKMPIVKIDPAKILAQALIKAVCPEKLKA